MKRLVFALVCLVLLSVVGCASGKGRVALSPPAEEKAILVDFAKVIATTSLPEYEGKLIGTTATELELHTFGNADLPGDYNRNNDMVRFNMVGLDGVSACNNFVIPKAQSEAALKLLGKNVIIVARVLDYDNFGCNLFHIFEIAPLKSKAPATPTPAPAAAPVASPADATTK